MKMSDGIKRALVDLRASGCDADADRIESALSHPLFMVDMGTGDITPVESALTKAEAVPIREFSAWVGDMKTSAGMDYYVCVGHGKDCGEYMTPNVYKVRGRAEYDVACWNHLFGHCDEPDILAFDTDNAPAVPVESLGRDADTKMEGWHAAIDAAAELVGNAPDDRFRRRAEQVERWIENNRPVPPVESPASVPDGCHVVRHNDDGEFGQKVGWLYRTGGDPCVISGKPVYVWRPIAELLETPA